MATPMSKTLNISSETLMNNDAAVSQSISVGFREVDNNKSPSGTMSSSLGMGMLGPAHQHPNYPPDDPIFYIPQVPKLTKVPPPAPPKKAPVAGYDTRTLKKQLDFLQSELEEKSRRQSLLYKQNEELWAYTQSLLQANESNSVIMKERMSNLHSELKTMHSERARLALQLETIRDSNELLAQLKQEVQDLTQSAEEEQRLSHEAEEALAQAKEENVKLAHTLEEELAKKSMLDGQLEDFRNRRRDAIAEELAVEHYRCSKAVLNSAYIRFKTGVKRRMRCTRIGQLFEDMHRRILLCGTWELWMGFMSRKMVRNEAIRRRRQESKALCFARWKVFSALERHFKMARRKRLLGNVFRLWSSVAYEARWEEAAERTIKDFELRKFKRKMFRAWKSHCMILQWHSDKTRKLEIKGIRHFVGTIFFAWKVTATQMSKEREVSKIAPLNIILARRPLRSWFIACRCLWRRRGNLLFRFYRNARQLVVKRAAWQVVLEHAVKLWAALQKRRAVRALRRLARARRMLVGRSKKCARRLGYFRHGKVLRQAMLTISRFGAQRRHQLASARVAEKHYNYNSILWGFDKWHTDTIQEVKKKRKAKRQLLRAVFDAWVLFVPMNRREEFLKSSVEMRYERALRSVKIGLLYRWKTRCRKIRRLKLCEIQLQRLKSRDRLRRMWIDWRCSWSAILFWREKEALLESNRSRALMELKQQELADVEKERARLQAAIKDVEESIRGLETAITKKDVELSDTLAEVERAKILKKEAEEQLALNMETLQKTSEELERLRPVEALLAAAEKREEDSRIARQQEAEQMLQKLLAESASLKEEVKEAQRQRILSERMAQSDVEREKQNLADVLNTAEQVEALLRQRRTVAEEMERENISIEDELSKVQKRIEDVEKTATDLVNEGESEIRLRTSRVRVMQANAGLAEARVAELRRLVLEQRSALLALQEREYRVLEDREIAELREIRMSAVSNPQPVTPVHGNDAFVSDTPHTSFHTHSLNHSLVEQRQDTSEDDGEQRYPILSTKKDLAGAVAWDETDSDSVVSFDDDRDMFTQRDIAESLQTSDILVEEIVANPLQHVSDNAIDGYDDSDISMGSNEDNETSPSAAVATTPILATVKTPLSSSGNRMNRNASQSTSSKYNYKSDKKGPRALTQNSIGNKNNISDDRLTQARAERSGGGEKKASPRSTQSARESLRRLHQRLQSPLNLK